jgi:hypothetical protein
MKARAAVHRDEEEIEKNIEGDFVLVVFAGAFRASGLLLS